MSNPLTTAIVLSIAAVNGFLAYLVFGPGMEHLYREGELLETLQPCFLALGGLAFLAALPRAEKPYRLALVASSLLCLTFVLREVDVEDYQLPQLLILLGSGTGRDAVLGAAWLAIAGWMATDYQRQMRMFRDCLVLRPGRLLIAGGAFLLLGSVLDAEWVSFSYHVFAEELAELDGCFLIFQAGLTCCAGLSVAPDCSPLAPRDVALQHAEAPIRESS